MHRHGHHGHGHHDDRTTTTAANGPPAGQRHRRFGGFGFGGRHGMAAAAWTPTT